MGQIISYLHYSFLYSTVVHLNNTVHPKPVETGFMARSLFCERIFGGQLLRVWKRNISMTYDIASDNDKTRQNR